MDEEVREFGSEAEFLAFREAMQELQRDEHDPLTDFQAFSTTDTVRPADRGAEVARLR